MSEPSARKKVLILTYYWPPAGGAGVQRVVKFVKYLPHFGYDPVVLTVRNGEYPTYDESLLKDIPTEVEVVKTPTVEFFRFFKILTGRSRKKGLPTTILKTDEPSRIDRIFRWIRYNFFIPDARVGWRPFAIRAGMKIIRRHRPDIIFSTSPPHSVQLIGRALHRRTGIPWVADFRDPWTEAFWLWELPQYPRAYRRNQQLEREVISGADGVITVSEGMRQVLNKSGRQMKVIPNGFDEESFAGYKKQDSGKFRLVYTGTLSKSQHPAKLLQALVDLPAEIRADITFDLYGAIDEHFKSEVQRLELEEMVQFHGYVPHAEAVQQMFDANLLVLLTPRTKMKGITTQKLFEYMATGNFILGFGDPEDDPARILEECEAGTCIDYADAVGPILRQQYESWARQGRQASEVSTKIKKYSRKILTEQLAGLFDRVLTGDSR